MAEYIARKAAIAYIREQSEECQKAFEELGGESGIYADAYNDLAEDFYSIPAADVVPVVRCRDCEHSYDAIGGRICAYGPCVGRAVENDFYCKNGKSSAPAKERREGDDVGSGTITHAGSGTITHAGSGTITHAGSGTTWAGAKVIYDSAAEDREICRRALDTFGTDMQTLVAIEELSELQKELCKNRRGRENQTNIAEEIADVQIMLEQMMMLYDCGEIVEKFRRYKLSRLEARIEEAQTNAQQ